MPTPYILKVQFLGVTKSSYGLGKDELVNVLLKHTHVHTHTSACVSASLASACWFLYF